MQRNQRYCNDGACDSACSFAKNDLSNAKSKEAGMEKDKKGLVTGKGSACGVFTGSDKIINSAGVKNDDGKIPLSLLSSTALRRIGEVLQFGAKKYDSHNWRKGIAYSRVTSAVLRHLFAWNEGEDLDSESGLNHLSHAACGIMFLLEYAERRPEFDDRFKHTLPPEVLP